MSRACRGRPRLPLYYGWVVVGLAFAFQALAYGVWYSYAVFFVALLREFGWTRAETAGAFSVFVLVHGAAGVLTGRLTDRFGARAVAAGGGALLAAALAACSTVTALWQLYLFFGVAVAVGVAAIGYVPMIALLRHWFSQRLGTATGITMSGVGFGILVFVPAAQGLLDALGWRATYLALAALMLLVPVAVLLFLRDAPEQVGQVPEGVLGSAGALRPSDDGRVVDRRWAGETWTLWRAAQTWRFWLMLTAFAAMYYTSQTVFVHQVALLTDAGYSVLLAASVAGLIGGVSIVGKLGWGILSDRLGREVVYTLGAGCVLVALALLALVDQVAATWFVVLYGVAFGIGYAVSAVIIPTMTADLFSGNDFGVIFGTMTLGVGLGSAGGAWAAGRIFDATGGYDAALALAAGSMLFSVVAVWLIAPRRVRLVPGRAHPAVAPSAVPAARG